MSITGSVDTSALGHTETQLRRQSLECLVAVLRSLVAWGTTNSGSINAGSIDGSSEQMKSNSEEFRPHSVTPDPSLEKISASSTTESTRIPTPDQMADDPTKFESAKQKKTTLLEGIKKFNFSPKRVGPSFIELWSHYSYNPPGNCLLHRDRFYFEYITSRYRSFLARDRWPEQSHDR